MYMNLLALNTVTIGGKRPFNSVKSVDRNPCFCLKPSICTIIATGKETLLSFLLFISTACFGFHNQRKILRNNQ